MVHHFLAFASDAKLLAATGVACWLVAGLALVADRRRHARVSLDRVGWVPWTGLFLAMAVRHDVRPARVESPAWGLTPYPRR